MMKPASLILVSAFCLIVSACEFKTERRVTKAAASESAAASLHRAEEEARIAAEAVRARMLTDTARFFAGLAVDPSSDFYDLTQTDVWKCFARKLNALWAAFGEPEVRMRAWAQRELAPVHDPSAPLFYPFSGPDIIFPEVFFPCSAQVILVGLEPVGAVPGREALYPQRLDEMLSLYMISVQDIVRLSFYRTRVMDSELASPMLKGIVPILMVSLARLGMDIDDLELGNLDENGEFIPEAEDSPTEKSAIRIHYRKASEALDKTLIYFSFDLSNAGLKKRPALEVYLQRNAARCFTLLKSASYLCRKPYFSVIRKTILSRSYAVLQDDSGLSYASFDRNTWRISLYGRYEGPVELFKDSFEQDLYDAMKKSAKRLNFRFGYSRASSLLLATKKPL